MAPEAKNSQQKEIYDLLIKTILSACQAKGWKAEVENPDKDYELATITVSKLFNYERVSAVLNVTYVNGRVKYSIQRTSYNSYGLDDLLDAITTKLESSGLIKFDKEKSSKVSPEPMEVLNTVLRNFERVVRQIKSRHDGRQTLEVKDEYDVQDLLHAILKAFFNDVRAEEYTPSYAGSSSKMDFLLKKEKIVVETKFASQNLMEKKIGEQLIVDIKKYQAHPDCDQLYCLVYDPTGVLRNPAELENDLSGMHEKISVKVLVVPK